MTIIWLIDNKMSYMARTCMTMNIQASEIQKAIENNKPIVFLAMAE
jgi:hypothetical protein